MSMARFLINFVVTFLLFGLLYYIVDISMPDLNIMMSEVGRPMDAPEQMWVMIGHVIQTIAYVWLFMKIVTQQCWKAGAMFGFMAGLLMIGVDMVYYGMMSIPADVSIVMIPVGVIISMIVGAILGLMNKPTA